MYYASNTAPLRQGNLAPAWVEIPESTTDLPTLSTETFGELDRYVPANDNEPPASRIGDWIQTFTGLRAYPMDLRPDEVCIEDIAHSLSMQCRYAGHCLRFYSVAEHSVHVARWVADRAGALHGLAALLHDASEAYLVDVPRPVKPFLAGYKAAENRAMDVILGRFGIGEILPDIVHTADGRILADELRQNMRPMDWHAQHDEPLGVTLRFWESPLAEEFFLAEFRRLSAIVEAA